MPIGQKIPARFYSADVDQVLEGLSQSNFPFENRTCDPLNQLQVGSCNHYGKEQEMITPNILVGHTDRW